MRLVFATNNANKLREVQSLIPNGIKLLSLPDIGCFENIPETQETIEGNAQQKANYIKSHYGYDCFADDTGLEVISLNNQQGCFLQDMLEYIAILKTICSYYSTI